MYCYPCTHPMYLDFSLIKFSYLSQQNIYIYIYIGEGKNTSYFIRTCNSLFYLDKDTYLVVNKI